MAADPASPVAEPRISVVVGGTGTDVAACLAALEPQRNGDQVIACEPRPIGEELRSRFPWVEWVVQEDALVPELWTEGIARSRGDIVALTIAPMIPADDWLASIRAQHEQHDVVAGAIEPAGGLRLADWAEYFCRYAPDMLPFDPREHPDLPGDNASYKRRLLEEVDDTYRDGFWEPDVHRRLAQDGARLWHAPSMVVRLGRSGGTRAFLRQRLHHGAAHGRQRGARYSAARNTIGVVAAPIVPLLLTVRMLRTVFARGRHRAAALRSTPLLVLYNVAWALGEARGHLRALRSS